ncbi:MAG TPA: hypothetical protein VED40_23255 [Azospirillaceae bacterium]|nr:hypothetical protein [Azospirillaceae bacterium]
MVQRLASSRPVNTAVIGTKGAVRIAYAYFEPEAGRVVLELIEVGDWTRRGPARTTRHSMSCDAAEDLASTLREATRQAKLAGRPAQGRR